MNIKERNFFTNLSYRRLNKSDHLNISFMTNYFSFIIHNINPFLLKREFTSQPDQHLHLHVVQKMHSL